MRRTMRQSRTLKYRTSDGTMALAAVWCEAAGGALWVIPLTIPPRQYVKVRRIRHAWVIDERP